MISRAPFVHVDHYFHLSTFVGEKKRKDKNTVLRYKEACIILSKNVLFGAICLLLYLSIDLISFLSTSNDIKSYHLTVSGYNH